MNLLGLFSAICVILINLQFSSTSVVQDEKQGFIVYCPCMGRFGNQAEQLLGALLFAKSLNRTLVLPPFINYQLHHVPTLVPFQDIIQVEPIRKFHRVVLMENFMTTDLWPPGRRRFYCYSARYQKTSNSTCDASKGQPFDTFWNSFNVTEDNSTFYKPLTTSHNQANHWVQEYPPSTHPVLAFIGAPSPFPADEDSIGIQKYIKLSTNIEKAAEKFKEENNFQNIPYLSMHIRHGPDWRKACELLLSDHGLVQLFSSNQCTGYTNLEDKIQFDTCLPSFDTISKKLNTSLHYYDKVTQNIDIKVVHIATDYEDINLWKRLRERFSHINFVITPRDQSNSMITSMVDIFLMANADVFIGNCVSSFSAFSARLRLFNSERNTYYFGQEFSKMDPSKMSFRKDEL